MDNTLIQLKVKLSEDSINALLLKNYNLTQIAKAHGVTASAVSHYISKHNKNIMYDPKNRDLLLTAKTNRIVNQGLDHVNDILSSSEFTKKDLSQLSMSTGIMFDKMRILENKSTENVSVNTITTNINERKAKREELLRELESV